MKSGNHSPILKDVSIQKNLLPYLRLTGWNSIDETNHRWYIYQIGSGKESELLEIILPKDPNAREVDIYIQNALDLLSAFSDENIRDVVRRIVYFDTDILFSRNLVTGEYNSIALRMASQQVYQLKRLVNYSAFSEHQPKPHFLQTDTALSRKMVEHYRFGHTFAGSFGYTILSPITHLPSPYVQMELFDEELPAPMTPIERRVMERIVRGLSITKQAVKQNDPQLLIREYASGFNGNMCQSIVRMSQDKRVPIEYKVLWSPQIRPADDVSEDQTYGFTEIYYNYLEYAANELKKLEPEYVTVKGRIVGLSSKDNPLGASAHRSVVIRGRYREDMRRPIDIMVELSKEDYINASQAHIEWIIVEVSGVLSRSGYNWRLTDATDFTIR